ncbi:MAG: hypothetical protein LBJ79_00455 [Endomicrobium sp.]|jgi:C4-dicarboxylate-specific signal transduction histidine kinase|nr:hypothetical protein [Endomicrobium sp.]
MLEFSRQDSSRMVKSKPETIIEKTFLNNNSYILYITDTGTGIANENISKIFAPFFTTKKVGKVLDLDYQYAME